MNLFFGTKQIIATSMNRFEYNNYRNWDLPSDENGADDGYLVEYVDGGASNHPAHKGYISWSPSEVFNRVYQPNGKMSFGHALEAMKLGHKVARTGWNGKGMWIAISCDGMKTVPAENFWSPHAKAHAEAQKGTAVVLPSVIMKTADGSILMGWLASQTDMLSEDWQILFD